MHKGWAQHPQVSESKLIYKIQLTRNCQCWQSGTRDQQVPISYVHRKEKRKKHKQCIQCYLYKTWTKQTQQNNKKCITDHMSSAIETSFVTDSRFFCVVYFCRKYQSFRLGYRQQCLPWQVPCYWKLLCLFCEAVCSCIYKKTAVFAGR